MWDWGPRAATGPPGSLCSLQGVACDSHSGKNENESFVLG